MSENKKLVILCFPISGMGHVNATVGIASVLKARGHTVVFAVERSWKGKLSEYGFEEEIYDEREVDTSLEPGEQWSQLIVKFSANFLKETIDQIHSAFKETAPIVISALSCSNDRLAEIIAQRKPDIIIQDGYVGNPALVKAKVPLIYLHSANPLRVLEDENLPPAYSGYGLNSDRQMWKKYRQRLDEVLREAWKEINDWILSQGAPSLRYPNIQYTSTNLNLYMYPRSLASLYLERRSSPSSWVGIDHCIRPGIQDFVVPEKLQKLPGKLIFVSLGSMGSAVVDFMKRIVDALSKCEHRFIVCCGHNHREYSLAGNMWGEPFLPQTAVLPHVDLVITHGGNNSFIETLYFGKPMIVIPLLGDQYDNAEMAEEVEIGLKFRLSSEPMENLAKKIDLVLNDQAILRNVQKLAKELHESQSLDEAASLVEAVAVCPRTPAVEELQLTVNSEL